MDCADVLEHEEKEFKAPCREPNSQPIPGYRLIQLLGRGGFGEVWKCLAPDGLYKAIKFVYGNLNGIHNASATVEDELKAVQIVKAIRHPFLLAVESVEILDGELVIVMELADCSLHDVLACYRAAGRPGIPRPQVLGFVRDAADALDLMNFQHGLQHLDVKPGNLFVAGNQVKVADFGLVSSLSGKRGAAIPLSAVSPLYAAPEIFHGAISRDSDQYSLAIVFQELLTGTLPFSGTNVRQLLLQHTTEEPDLRALPACDRPVVGRALEKNPKNRYGSCAEFVRALTAS
jgi:eukaryotic-like serine/threonine-protein kinase